VILSLWSVRDEDARDWMALLYRHRFIDGLDTATSVRDAARTLLGERRAAGLDTHPFHWGAFTAAGDWR
jgi:CHAT domain-containing protein